MVWHHTLTHADAVAIRTAPFPVRVVHGAHDLLAMPRYGAALARRLHAPLALLAGAHFIVRECAEQVGGGRGVG